MLECQLDCEDCRHLTVVGLHDTGPRTVNVTECHKVVCVCVCVCMWVCVCVCVCVSLVCMVGVIFVYADTVFVFCGYSCFMLSWMFPHDYLDT